MVATTFVLLFFGDKDFSVILSCCRRQRKATNEKNCPWLQIGKYSTQVEIVQVRLVASVTFESFTELPVPAAKGTTEEQEIS